jgi:TPR repeat protein
MTYTKADYADLLVLANCDGVGEARDYLSKHGFALEGDPDAIVGWLKSRSLEGDASAHHALAEGLTYGLFGKVEHESALFHCDMAASRNHPAALLLQYRIRAKFSPTIGKSEILTPLEHAVALDYPPSIRVLSLLYELGQFVEKDLLKAAELLKKAADLGDAYSMATLGLALISGGGKHEEARGLEYVRAAAEKNHEAALFELAAYYRRGLYGLPRDVERAASLDDRYKVVTKPYSLGIKFPG